MPIVRSWNFRHQYLAWIVATSIGELMLLGACSRGGEKLDAGADAAMPVDGALPADGARPSDDAALDAAHAADLAGQPDAATPRDAAVPPDLTPPDAAVPPDLTPPSTDPFEPTSCSGAPLVLADKFPAGASTVVIATYTMQYQKRSCTDFTGCGSWGPATPSWGPSGSGRLYLKVTGTGIIAAVVDNNAGSASGTPVYNLGMDCKLGGSLWDCGTYHDTEIAEGANFLKFEGSDKFHGVELPVSGELRATCGRFFGNATGVKAAGAYKEYRGGFLVRY